ncbi:MAG: hypothetical protein ACYC1D_11055 [Acidimicrobiales bacterium]
MARRIDIELTSVQADGTWTWRAAGARQPRGVLDGALLHDGAKSGDVVRAEAEFEIEGITIVSVVAPRDKKRPEPERLEILGPSRPASPGVTTQLAGRADRGPSDRRPPEASGPERHRGRREGRPGVERPKPERDHAQRRPDRPRQERPARSPEPAARNESGRGVQPGDGRPEGSRPEARRPEGSERRVARGGAPRSASPPAPRSKRLNAGNTHRQEVLNSLPPEQQPVAEQVLRGGIPAVRTAIHLEREKAAVEGRQAPNADALLAMAEQLLPRLKAAEWRDRAEAAVKAVDEIALRDLRAVVAGGDLARDDETRRLVTTLREALERRLALLQSEWTSEIGHHLDEGRVVRALRLASRPAEANARLDPALNDRLVAAAGQAMAPDTPPERWAALLDAVAESPVRRSVQPLGLPPDPGPELRRAAHQASGRIPALAAMLGIAIPPPPGPRRPAGGAPIPTPPSRRPPPPPEPRPVPPAAAGDAPSAAVPPEATPAGIKGRDKAAAVAPEGESGG